MVVSPTQHSAYGIASTDELFPNITALPGLHSDLTSVVETLRARCRCIPTPLVGPASHLANAPSKSLRATFLLAASYRENASRASDAVLHAASAVELLHLATLYHDDVIDTADQRRGVYSANAVWGNATAILAGDALVACAFGLVSRIEHVRALADVYLTIAAGQQHEMDARFVLHDDSEVYFGVIAMKTAALFSAACAIGAASTGHAAQVVDNFAAFGRDYGIAFQLMDDVWDIVPRSESGKRPGADLRAGIYTLPVIQAAAMDPGLRRLIARYDDAAQNEILDAVRSDGASLAYAADVARTYVARAMERLDELPSDALGREPLQSACRHLDAAASVAHSTYVSSKTYVSNNRPDSEIQLM